MDERLGRSVAKRLGLQVTGLVGVLVDDRERGLLRDPKGVVDDLQELAGFWLSPELRGLIIGP
jgi:predicted nucleic acid-binding protein